MAAEAVEHGLDVDLADALERAREEGVHRQKLPRGMDFDVVLAELGVETLERLNLCLGELDLALADRLPPTAASRWWRVWSLLRMHRPRTPPN